MILIVGYHYLSVETIPRCYSECSYMVYSSYQIWFLSPPKFFFQLFVFPYSLLVEVYYAFFHCSFQGTSLIVFAFPC